MLSRIMESLRRNGLADTARKGFHRTLDRLDHAFNQQRRWRDLDRLLARSPSRAEVFNFIYEKNAWSTHESKSGPGSTLQATENIRNHLLNIIERFGVRSIYDAPCGDFNWMQHVLGETDINYIGADIVSSLVKDNQSKYGSYKAKFIVGDIAADDFPAADLWLCRDCLPHFSNSDIFSALERFCNSNIKYVLTSSHYKDHQGDQSVDILTGRFRTLDLFSSPFSFPKAIQYRFRDSGDEDPVPREMVLLLKTDIKDALPGIKRRLNVS